MPITYTNFNPDYSVSYASTTNVEFSFFDDGTVSIDIEAPDGGTACAHMTLQELMELSVRAQDYLNKRK